MKLEFIAFDADDTLWHNEHYYVQAQDEYVALLSGYADADTVRRRLDETEEHNVKLYGYGIKSFTLSMMENAISVSEGRLDARIAGQILDLGKQMLTMPVEMLDGVEAVLVELSKTYPLMLITKGDLQEQELKIERSGIAGYFRHVEVVREKTVRSYGALFTQHKINPARFLMVGNSLRSDILPVVELGGQAVYIPYALTWAHEVIPGGVDSHACHELEKIDQLPELIARLEQE